MPAYNQNEEITYIKNPYVDENHFINQKPKTVKLPKFEEVKEKLPKPVWKNHEKEIECYYKAWEIAFSNLHNPEEKMVLSHHILMRHLTEIFSCGIPVLC